MVHRQAEKLTSAEMIKLFDDLQELHASAIAISVVLDNARNNHSRELRAYLSADGCWIKPVYLPSYAPNLNLIERFWGLFKKKALHNEYFPTSAEFKAEVDGFFVNLDYYRDEIARLISDAFHFIGQPQAQPP